MVDPKKIEFEDDIILAIKAFIKKTGSISQTLWTIFPHLTKVFDKSKKTFGNLLRYSQLVHHQWQRINCNKQRIPHNLGANGKSGYVLDRAINNDLELRRSYSFLTFVLGLRRYLMP